jgi:putative glutamine amidotransferase
VSRRAGPRQTASRRSGGHVASLSSKRPEGTGRPLIGVTGHRPSGEGAPRGTVAAKEAYLAAVLAAGGLPVVLAPVETREEIEAILDAVDGLLFTGGQDIDPARFGQPLLNQTVKTEPDRDAFELPLIREAIARDLPLLAVCRGCQVLNVALGGTLWQDLPAQRPQGLPHRQEGPRSAVTHAVRIEPESLLARVVGDERTLLTNTFHHQAARDVAPGLAVSATAPDGTVEALEAPRNRFVLGVQWHPEDLVPARAAHRRLFRALVDAARSAPRAAQPAALTA